jgi:hypothetical protein
VKQQVGKQAFQGKSQGFFHRLNCFLSLEALLQKRKNMQSVAKRSFSKPNSLLSARGLSRGPLRSECCFRFETPASSSVAVETQISNTHSRRL